MLSPKEYWSRKLSLGRLKFYFGFSDKNFHGTQRDGESWNQQTIKGPLFKWVVLKHESAGFSRRVIYYARTGAWYYLDIYFTVSRMYKTVGECFRATKKVFSSEEK